MTTREWIERTFGTDGQVFRPCDPDDFVRYNVPGVNPAVMPRTPPDADVEAFVRHFGSAIDAALSSGGSIYAALTDGTVQDRGWRPYFELWRVKGIIN